MDEHQATDWKGLIAQVCYFYQMDISKVLTTPFPRLFILLEKLPDVLKKDPRGAVGG